MKKKMLSFILAAMMAVQGVVPAMAELEDTEDFVLEEMIEEQTPEVIDSGEPELVLGEPEEPVSEEQETIDGSIFTDENDSSFAQEEYLGEYSDDLNQTEGEIVEDDSYEEDLIITEEPDLTEEALSGTETFLDEGVSQDEEEIQEDLGSGEIEQVGGIADSGTCGDNLTWKLTDDGVLTVSGTGNMEEWSFSSNSSIKKVVITSGVTNIGSWAFYNCSSLTEVTISNSVTSIENNAFHNCQSLKSLTIPDSVTNIGDCAFMFCNSLPSVTIPSGVTNIGRSAFQECSSLTSITVLSGNTSYSSQNGVLFNKAKTQLICFPTGKSGAYVIPDTVTSIGDAAFIECRGLTKVTIGNGVKNISEGTFFYCKSLTSFIVSSGNASYSSQDGILYNKNMTELISCPEGKSEANAIPDGVKSIVYPAFCNCNNLTSITIPKSVTSIEESAFYDSNRLSNVYYTGSEKEWNLINIGSFNEFLLNATRHYANTYTVSFNPNGGTGAPTSQEKTHGITLTLSATKPSKKYTINYNANGGSVSPSSKTVNCTFKNWNTAANGSGTTYASGGSYTSDASVTLYAQWTNPKAGTLTTPTRNGYDFVGWFSSATGGTQITSSSTISKNMTVYAHWTDAYDIYNMGDETYSFVNYGDSDSFGGHCFGMSITSAGYYNNLLDIGRIGGNANTPLYSFSRTSTVKQPICYYQKIQGSFSAKAIVAGGSSYLYNRYDISSDWKAVVNYVRDHSYDNTGLLQIGFRKNDVGGHAINFLRYESVNGQDRIYAYDNNFPEQETYFYRDSSGNIRQAPVQTFSGTIDCMALRDVRRYYSNAANYDKTHVIYMAEDSATVQGYNVLSYMEGEFSDEEYVMCEIPAGQDHVVIIPNKDFAEFTYMDNNYSFGEVTDETYGILKLASSDESAGSADAIFTIENNGRANMFSDVTDPSLFYYEPIYWAVDNGITTGYKDNTFRPYNNCNRAAVVTFLWRLAGKPTPSSMATFIDMTDNTDFDTAISWAAENGITTGYDDNTFRPWDTCNRAAIVTFLWRYAGRPEPTSMASFSDMTNNDDFDHAISWAAENNITTGYTDGTFRPWNQCLRLAVVSFLYRYEHL